MRRMIIGLAAGLMALPLAAQEVAPLPGFLLGTWIQREGDKWAEESWSGGPAGMRGTSREGAGDRVESQESLTIVRRDGTLVLIAQPRGAEPVPFPMVSHDERSVVFANPAHDYPQRIRYWRESDTLHAEIALLDGSQPVTWSYAPKSE
jgi:hypothetical protein